MTTANLTEVGVVQRRRLPQVPKARARHLLNRFTYGITPDLARTATADPDLAAWFEAQLEPQNVPDPYGDELVSWYPVLERSPQQLAQDLAAGTMNVPTWATDFQRWTLLRQLTTTRQVAERMAAFWSELLYIPVPEGKSWVHRFSYDAMIREGALGRFDDLLVAAETHPAMCCYLDNAGSTRTQLNENLGREVLELHTIGRSGGYTEDEVVDSARILTGYRVRMWETWEPYYAPSDHHVGPVQVLGFSSPNAEPDGRPVAEAYLRYLARHPFTARRIAERLCVRFVRDEPSAKLVEAVATAYRSSGTDIKATLRAMISHPDFHAAAGQKIRTPTEDVVATYRGLGIIPRKPSSPSDLANAMVWHAAAVGQRPFDWPRPDGPPDRADAWASVGRTLSSWRIHYGATVGASALTGIAAPPLDAWVPRLPADVATVIDNASRLLLGRSASLATITAAAGRMGLTPHAMINSRAELADWRIQLLLCALLDSPEHFVR